MTHKKVLVFGVFDGLHEGHKFFLKEAKKLGKHLTVVVTPDIVVQKIKGRLPRYSFAQRKSFLESENYINEILEGDSDLESWKVFEKIQPNLVATGYDQVELKSSLEKYFENSNQPPEIISIHAFEPEKYKSSLMNG